MAETAASDVEAQGGKPTADSADAEQQSVGVGVLGWLGFIIVNLAAWGIVGVTTAISWIFGLGVCLLYIALLIGLAFWLERSGSVYKQFINLLWVLAGWFVFIAGAYIAVNTLGRDGISTGPYPTGISTSSWEFNQGVQDLLPSSASASLKNWALRAGRYPDGTDYITFGGSVFFNGRVNGVSQFLRVTGGQTVQVSNSGLALTTFQSKLFFADNSRIYSIEENNGVFSDPQAAFSYVGGDEVQGIYVENNVMYYKVSRSCVDPCTGWNSEVITIFSSSTGTDSTDLRGDACDAWSTLKQSESACGTGDLGGGGVSSVLPGPSVESIWGVIFMAAVPMLILSFVVLIRKKMPGLFFNIFGGIVAIVVMVYALVNTQPTQGGLDAVNFFKWFFLIFTSVQWIALVAWSLAVEKQEEWLEELKTWATGVVGVTFFITIHFVLEIPFKQDWWLWVIYGLLALTQMLFSAVVKRTLPMVTGALGAFVVAWKVASEVSQAFQISSYQLQILALFGIIGLEGVGIILAAIAFARNRDAIQDGVRELLSCQRCRQKHSIAL